MKKIKLGDKVKDTITGFEGIATTRAEFLNGCVQIKIQPQGLTKNGEMKEGEFVDIDQIEKVAEPKPEKPKKVKTKKPGGGFRDTHKITQNI